LDLGRISGNDSLKLEVKIQNRANREIRLKYIFAQCDCTILVPDSAIVPARGQHILQVELLTRDQETGWVEELITILTDVETQPELTIPVTAYVTNRLDDEGRENEEELARPAMICSEE